MKFLDAPPRFLFFTGKGGVGKTSIACATAIALARQGKRVLLVSTDPASNVGQVFGLTIGNTITAIPAVEGLSALEIDPEQAADAYRERIVGPVRGLLPDAEVASITEQLSGSCTTEIASFNEFTELLTDSDGELGQFDHVLFDTAPTGHTIRLLQLPGSWTDFLNDGKGDASCLGPLSGLEKQRAVYAAAVAALADPQRTRLVLVARAQRSTLAEITRTHRELAAIGLTHQYVVINGVLPASAGHSDPLAAAIYQREQQAIASLPDELRALPLDQVDLKPTNIVGLDALASLFTSDAGAPDEQQELALDVMDTPLANLIDELATGDHGLIMCMGKGGVGKTTIAAAIAVALAQPWSPSAPDHDRPRRAPHRHSPRNTARTCRCRASTRSRRPASTAIMCSPPRAPRSMSRAGRRSPRIFARHAPRKSPCSRRSRASSVNRCTSSSSSTPHRPGTRCCSSMPPAPTIARSPGNWATDTSRLR